jgi:hypothetical protein
MDKTRPVLFPRQLAHGGKKTGRATKSGVRASGRRFGCYRLLLAAATRAGFALPDAAPEPTSLCVPSGW